MSVCSTKVIIIVNAGDVMVHCAVYARLALDVYFMSAGPEVQPRRLDLISSKLLVSEDSLRINLVLIEESG